MIRKKISNMIHLETLVPTPLIQFILPHLLSSTIRYECRLIKFQTSLNLFELHSVILCYQSNTRNLISADESDILRNELPGSSDYIFENRYSPAPQDAGDFSTSVMKQSEPPEDFRNLSLASIILAFQRLYIRCLHSTLCESSNTCSISNLKRFVVEDAQVIFGGNPALRHLCLL